MPPKKNSLKLNKLQLRTLALAQVLAEMPDITSTDEATGDVTVFQLPHAHGDHMHIGEFVISARDASGLTNPAVWTALQRKGLAHSATPLSVTLTADGVRYDTGLADRFLSPSSH
jgi:hypothetical protein